MKYGGFFDLDSIENRIKELDEFISVPGFWNDQKKAEEIIDESNNLKKKVQKVSTLKQSIYDNIDMILILEDTPDNEIISMIEESLPNIEENFKSLRLELMLNGLYDKNDALLEIHAGAGGTESCDWASMLMRMYLRWCDNKNYKYEIYEVQNGEEAGVKRAHILVKGFNAYGYLKSERGVHRLVRISPFDSNKRRHTSFVAIEVIPQVEDNIEVDIKESEIKIDVYRSSGAGGQSVNTTDSAVRITHLPTGIVVTCQNERSQIKNKEKAMKVLKSKLYQLEIEKRDNSLSNMKGDQSNINFGSQIRSYVMHPYMMVKDHRTEAETSNVLKVLDGDIDLFIESYLRRCINDKK